MRAAPTVHRGLQRYVDILSRYISFYSCPIQNKTVTIGISSYRDNITNTSNKPFALFWVILKILLASPSQFLVIPGVTISLERFTNFWSAKQVLTTKFVQFRKILITGPFHSVRAQSARQQELHKYTRPYAGKLCISAARIRKP